MGDKKMESKLYLFEHKNFQNFVGKWVAISNHKVISSGKSFKKVFNEAKAKDPQKKPFITKIPKDETLIL